MNKLLFLFFLVISSFQFTRAQSKANKLVVKGNEFFEKMDYKMADSYYDKALALDSNCLEAYIQKSDIFIQSSDFNNSFHWIQLGLNAAQKANENSETIAHIYSVRSFIYFSLNDYKNAINDLNTAISFNSENSNYYYMRALIRRINSDLKGCCADLKKASSLGLSKADESLTVYCK